MEVGNQGVRGKKAQKQRREKSLRIEIKGAESAKGAS